MVSFFGENVNNGKNAYTHRENYCTMQMCIINGETINPELLNDGHIQEKKKWVYSCLQNAGLERGYVVVLLGFTTSGRGNTEL